MNSQPVDTTEAQQDAQDILSLLDGLAGKPSAEEAVNSDAPLTAAEQEKLAMFLGEPAPGDLAPHSDAPPSDGQENTKNPGLNTLGNEIEGLFSQLQNQLETVIAKHASLSQELEATKSRIEQKETTSRTEVPQVISTPGATSEEDLRPVLDKITHWRSVFGDQFQHLLALVQDSMIQQQQLEASLVEANLSIQKSQKQRGTRSAVKPKNTKAITALREELSDQNNRLSATQAKFKKAESNRTQAEQILRKLKTRLKKKPPLSVAKA
ncbi:MAG: hypothetical protein HQ515_05580 [Phycisphaeraceae bacterium]|nr:hypothetical protein [Phycisphaeraceae bacterium]